MPTASSTTHVSQRCSGRQQAGTGELWKGLHCLERGLVSGARRNLPALSLVFFCFFFNEALALVFSHNCSVVFVKG